MKTLYLLITIHQCVGWLMKSREAAAWVARKHPEIRVTYQCRERT